MSRWGHFGNRNHPSLLTDPPACDGFIDHSTQGRKEDKPNPRRTTTPSVIMASEADVDSIACGLVREYLVRNGMTDVLAAFESATVS